MKMANSGIYEQLRVFIKKWYNHNFPLEGQGLTDDFKEFSTGLHEVFNGIGEYIDFECYKYDMLYFNAQCVLESKRSGLKYYIQIADVRSWKNKWADAVMWKVDKGKDNWQTKEIHYCKLYDLAQELLKADITERGGE